MSSDLSWRVGDAVEAEFQGQYYDAIVRKRLPGYRFVVQWDDGSTTTGTPADLIRPRRRKAGVPQIRNPLPERTAPASLQLPTTPPPQPLLPNDTAAIDAIDDAFGNQGDDPVPQLQTYSTVNTANTTPMNTGGCSGVNTNTDGSNPRARGKHTLTQRRHKAVRALTGTVSETPHYSLIKALSAVQLTRGKFLSHFNTMSEGSSVDFDAFSALFQMIFETGGNESLAAEPPTLCPSAKVEVLKDRESAQTALIERVFHFFDFDSDGSISVDEISRFAQAPLAKGDFRAPKHIMQTGKAVTVPMWKRELWDEVLKETQSALLRSLGLNVDVDVSKRLSKLWRTRPHVSHSDFLVDVKKAGCELSAQQEEIIFEVADSMGHSPPTVDTALVLQFCTLDPDVGTDSSFPITFTEHQHRRANDQIGLILYLPFVLLFTYFIIADKGLRASVWVHTGVSDLFLYEEFYSTTTTSNGVYFKKSFYDIGDETEFWEWVDGPLVAGFWGDGRGANAIQFSNAPIGALKFRQKRVSVSTAPMCTGQKHMFESGAERCAPVGSDEHTLRISEFRENECYPDWGDGTENTDDYSLLVEGDADREWTDANGVVHKVEAHNAWVYSSCGTLNGTHVESYLGKTAQFVLGYDCGGFADVLNFGMDKSEVIDRFSQLKQAGWIDDQTRAVIVTFFTYNTNIRLFTRFEFAIEFSAGGALIPTMTSHPFRLFDWRTHHFAYNFFLVLYFVTLFFFIMWFLKRLANRVLRKHRATGQKIAKSFLVVLIEHPWFLYDFANYVIFLVTTSIRFEYMRRGLTEASIVCVDSFPQAYDSLSSLVHLMSILDGINAVLTYSRIFYYLRLNNTVNVLLRTLGTAAWDIFAICVISTIIFLAFALCAHIVYGHVVVGYRDMFSTFSSLARALIGDFSYEEMREARRVFSPLFMVAFVIICVVVLFNLVIAVLTESFSEVKRSNWDYRRFVNKARHDPAVSLPPQSVKKFFNTSSLFREVKMHAITLIYLCGNICGKKQDPNTTTPREARYQKRWRENPRTFWKDYLKLFCRLERGTPKEMIRASVCLMQLEFAADPRVSVTSRREGDMVPVSVGLGGAAQYRVESVQSFLRRELGGWHTLVSYERMLIKIPCMQLGLTESVLWQDLLEYHHHWQRSVASYTRFDLPMEDRVTDIHDMMCGKGGTFETGDWNKHALCSLLVNMHHYVKFLARDVNLKNRKKKRTLNANGDGFGRRKGGLFGKKDFEKKWVQGGDDSGLDLSTSSEESAPEELPNGGGSGAVSAAANVRGATRFVISHGSAPSELGPAHVLSDTSPDLQTTHFNTVTGQQEDPLFSPSNQGDVSPGVRPLLVQ